MSRLVTISNRVAIPKGAGAPPGGLAVDVLSALRASGGLWFGWNGDADSPSGATPQITERDGITFATIALRRELHELSYSGFANGTLWPLFHYFLDGFRYRDREYEAYQEVNDLFAQELLPLLRSDDLIWVHDYHLIPLAEKLRARGVRARIGFFLHVPFPHFEVLRALPVFPDLMRALLTYDVIGFQTETDRQAFLGALDTMWGSFYLKSNGAVVVENRVVAVDVFPIGVDVEAIGRSAEKAVATGPVQRLQQGLLDRRLIIGVDRLDYSKGLLERFEAYRHFLESHPEHLGKVTYLQIAPLGRQNVKAYTRIVTRSSKALGGRTGVLLTRTGRRFVISIAIFRMRH